MSTLDLMITFDTEDVYNPAEAGMDDVPKALADILYEEGLPVTFMLIAKRARLLKARGRDDVIAALKRHSVGVHTLQHDQPYDTVRVADLDWPQGLEVCREMEGLAYRQIAEAFDCQPVAFGGHCANEVPQFYAVARELGLPCVYGYAAAPPLRSFSRFCGALNFPLPGDHDPNIPYFEGFDDALSDQPAFERHLERFAAKIDQCLAAKQPAMLIHPCHPVKTYSIDWIDGYMTANGVNIPPEEWPRRRQPGIRTRAQVELSQRNFRRLARWIRRHPHLNVISLSEAAAKYGRTPEAIGRLDLLAAAQRALAQREIAIEERYSPAEVVLGWAEALLAFARNGGLPATLPRRDLLGPMEDPLMIPEDPCTVGWPVVLGLAGELQRGALAAGHLPANLALPGGARVGLGSAYRALAEAYLAACHDGRAPESVELQPFARQPRLGVALGHAFQSVAECAFVAPNLNVDRLYRTGKLQSWTLAPAWYPEVYQPA